MLQPPSPPARPPGLFKRIVDAVRLPPRATPFSEMGVSGTAVRGGYVQTREKSPAWIGQQRYTSIADMAVNTSIVAAGVHYFLNLIAHPRWTVTPADDSDEAKVAAEFVQECLETMEAPWSRVVRRAGTFQFYGFGIQEWTAKKRPDGRVGLDSVEPRPQYTIEQWSVSEDGAVAGVWQRSPTTGVLVGLPRSKFLYLVDDVLTDSPEGIGIFRHLAEPWERLKAYYALETRAFERDLRGIPVGRIPYTLINEAVKANEIKQEDADKLVEAMEAFVKLQVKQSDTSITLDSLPYYSQAADGAKVAGLPQWGLELIQGSATGVEAVGEAIRRTQLEMARILTCEHLLMGENSGNRSLSEDKSRNLYLVANSVLSDISAGVDHDIIPPLCMLNSIPEELIPYCEVEDVAFKDAEAVAATLARMAVAGAMLAPDDPVIADVRSLMGVSAPAPVSPELQGLPVDQTLDDTEPDPNDPNAEATDEQLGKGFDPNQPRDEQGQWTGGGGISSAGSPEGVLTALHQQLHASTHEFPHAEVELPSGAKLNYHYSGKVQGHVRNMRTHRRIEIVYIPPGQPHGKVMGREKVLERLREEFASLKKIAKAAPKTLYVRRQLLNADEVRAWAAQVGLATALPPDDMHVTVAFSKEPLDWSAVSPDPFRVTVVGGDRSVHQFPARSTPNGALVLRFSSSALTRRWQYYRDAGASWDFSSYEPHITLTYSLADASGLDLPPYEGPLAFGPEILEEVSESWADELNETTLTKGVPRRAPKTSM